MIARELETIQGPCLSLSASRAVFQFGYRRKGGNSEVDNRIFGVAANTENSVYLAGGQYRLSSSMWNFAVLKINAGGDLLWQWEVRLKMEKGSPKP